MIERQERRSRYFSGVVFIQFCFIGGGGCACFCLLVWLSYFVFFHGGNTGMMGDMGGQ